MVIPLRIKEAFEMNGKRIYQTEAVQAFAASMSPLLLGGAV